ncbi:hypothetical protein Tsubulata_012065 [Turnera subulata]|uniref:LisH domain-containing protein n=1 Tax=Turnera subulata TaxID=218843 RepID=A0A9Q0J4Y9_9ROSI|nr:hypothetical protein Tsubulata_012065 [Turnera subulata]
MSQTNWEADKMLDVYIHDYLVKRDLKASAQAFQAEGKVSSDPVGKYFRIVYSGEEAVSLVLFTSIFY